jgi:hypothetical protein
MSKQPVRLAKKEPETNFNQFYNSLINRVEAWVNAHALLCLFVCGCLLIALFVSLIFVMTGVSATESGVTYNQLENII